jgi:hypothetical protein
MSTLKVSSIQNPSTSSGGVSIDTSGHVTVDGVQLPSSGPLSGTRNRIINGDMRIDQRNAGASVSVTNAAAYYAVDRFRMSGTASSGVFTGQQVADAPASFVNSLKITVTTADASLAAADEYYVSQPIEGFNVADLGFGTADAKPITISFWVKSSVTGSYGGSLSNSAFNRSYPFTYSISSANTWEYKTITVLGDTSGTWLQTNGIGIRLYFCLGLGSNFSGTAGSWASAGYISASGATNLLATNGATFYITGVQLEAGSVATPFERRSYGQELALCQRYFTVIASGNSASIGAGSNYNATTAYGNCSLPVTMRATPTISATTGTGYYVFVRNDAGDACNSLTLGSATTHQLLEFYNNTEISGTAGHGGFWRTGNASAFFAVQSEL